MYSSFGGRVDKTTTNVAKLILKLLVHNIRHRSERCYKCGSPLPVAMESTDESFVCGAATCTLAHIRGGGGDLRLQCMDADDIDRMLSSDPVLPLLAEIAIENSSKLRDAHAFDLDESALRKICQHGKPPPPKKQKEIDDAKCVNDGVLLRTMWALTAELKFSLVVDDDALRRHPWSERASMSLRIVNNRHPINVTFERRRTTTPLEQVYHGSSLDSWHKLLKHMPRSMSRTSHMTNGAAYGEGIYVSPTLLTAESYAKGARRLVGVFDLDASDSTRVTKHGAFCYVVKDPALMRLTHLLVLK